MLRQIICAIDFVSWQFIADIQYWESASEPERFTFNLHLWHYTRSGSQEIWPYPVCSVRFENLCIFTYWFSWWPIQIAVTGKTMKSAYSSQGRVLILPADLKCGWLENGSFGKRETTVLKQSSLSVNHSNSPSHLSRLMSVCGWNCAFSLRRIVQFQFAAHVSISRNY